MANLIKKIRDYIKYNALARKVFTIFLNSYCGVLKKVIPTNKKKILFIASGGRKFDDSPKAIYDYMMNVPDFKDYEFIWAFENPEKYELPRGRKVNANSFSYYKEAISSGIWIANATVGRGADLKTKNTYYINTWHGHALKKDEADYENDYDAPAPVRKKYEIDFMCAQSEFSKKVYGRIFSVRMSDIHICGFPRNDILFSMTDEDKKTIKKKLGIPQDKKVILFAPTYREYERDKLGQTELNVPIDFSNWKTFGDEYVVLFRAHYLVAQYTKIENKKFVIDVSAYEPLSDLLYISDILISDYSSIFFDYSLLDKPMLCYAYDYETYLVKRGLYMDIDKELPSGICKTEQDLIDSIANMDYSTESEKTRAFHKKYMVDDGHSSEYVVKHLLKKINNAGE